MSVNNGDTHAAGRGVLNDTNSVNSDKESVSIMTAPDIRAQSVLCYTRALYAAYDCETLLAKRWADLGFTAGQLADDLANASMVTDTIKKMREQKQKEEREREEEAKG